MLLLVGAWGTVADMAQLAWKRSLCFISLLLARVDHLLRTRTLCMLSLLSSAFHLNHFRFPPPPCYCFARNLRLLPLCAFVLLRFFVFANSRFHAPVVFVYFLLMPPLVLPRSCEYHCHLLSCTERVFGDRERARVDYPPHAVLIFGFMVSYEVLGQGREDY